MGNVLDAIVKKTILKGPQTVNADFETSSFDISGVERSFSIQFDYSSGSTVDMVIRLEVSVDGNTFVPSTETDQTITDNSGTHIWEVGERGVNYIRVAVVVTTGSIDIDKVEFSGNRRH